MGVSKYSDSSRDHRQRKDKTVKAIFDDATYDPFPVHTPVNKSETDVYFRPFTTAVRVCLQTSLHQTQAMDVET